MTSLILWTTGVRQVLGLQDSNNKERIRVNKERKYHLRLPPQSKAKELVDAILPPHGYLC